MYCHRNSKITYWIWSNTLQTHPSSELGLLMIFGFSKFFSLWKEGKNKLHQIKKELSMTYPKCKLRQNERKERDSSKGSSYFPCDWEEFIIWLLLFIFRKKKFIPNIPTYDHLFAFILNVCRGRYHMWEILKKIWYFHIRWYIWLVWCFGTCLKQVLHSCYFRNK